MKTVSTHEICLEVLAQTVQFWQKQVQNLKLQINNKRELKIDLPLSKKSSSQTDTRFSIKVAYYSFFLRLYSACYYCLSKVLIPRSKMTQATLQET